MTDEEINCQVQVLHRPVGYAEDYVHDLNAIDAAVCAWCNNDGRRTESYVSALIRFVLPKCEYASTTMDPIYRGNWFSGRVQSSDLFDLVNATPRQKCEALLAAAKESP